MDSVAVTNRKYIVKHIKFQRSHLPALLFCVTLGAGILFFRFMSFSWLWAIVSACICAYLLWFSRFSIIKIFASNAKRKSIRQNQQLVPLIDQYRAVSTWSDNEPESHRRERKAILEKMKEIGADGFQHMNFTNMDLSGFNFEYCHFQHCVFLNTNLSNATFKYSLFDYCSFTSCNFEKTNFSDVVVEFLIKFEKSNLGGIILNGANFKKAMTFIEDDYGVPSFDLDWFDVFEKQEVEGVGKLRSKYSIEFLGNIMENTGIHFSTYLFKPKNKP